jgi:hypothetical protein
MLFADLRLPKPKLLRRAFIELIWEAGYYERRRRERRGEGGKGGVPRIKAEGLRAGQWRAVEGRAGQDRVGDVAVRVPLVGG